MVGEDFLEVQVDVDRRIDQYVGVENIASELTVL
jgi:hypothetical protein